MKLQDENNKRFVPFLVPQHVVMEPLNASARGTHYGLGVKVTASTQSLDLDMRYGFRRKFLKWT